MSIVFYSLTDYFVRVALVFLVIDVNMMVICHCLPWNEFGAVSVVKAV